MTVPVGVCVRGGVFDGVFVRVGVKVGGTTVGVNVLVTVAVLVGVGAPPPTSVKLSISAVQSTASLWLVSGMPTNTLVPIVIVSVPTSVQFVPSGELYPEKVDPVRTT